MPSHEPRRAFETHPTAEDVTAVTPAFVAITSYDYDDGCLGCEAMIGALSSGLSGSWQR
jgi:hypothetical protein